jgi:hypothetical protein
MPARKCPTAVAAAGCSRLEAAADDADLSQGFRHFLNSNGMVSNKPSLASIESSSSVCPEIFTVAYFQNHQSCRGCKIHNHALKYWRLDAETTGRSAITFHNTNPAKMKEMVLGPSTEFNRVNFIGDQTIDWHWQEMVAQLDAKSLELVVGGQCMSANRSRGLVSCRLQKTDKCDLKRNRAQKRHRTVLGVDARIHTEEQLMVWDFVLVRANGTEVWLHPSYTSTTVECFEPFGPDAPICPRTPGCNCVFCTWPTMRSGYFKTLLHFREDPPNGNDEGNGN